MTDALALVRAQDTAVAVLRRALASNSVHHAYLFDGPPGVGKELTAVGLAQALVCERRAPDGDRACGECSACRRALLTKDGVTKHPDVVVIARALYEPMRIGRRTPETQDISIDQIRTLVLARSAFGPHEGRAKVFIVRAAEELSISAANALLKTLEEPSSRTHFILLSAQPNELLPTVRSRAMRVRFGSLPESTVVELLLANGITEERARAAAATASGSMQDALISADEELAEARDAWVDNFMGSIKARARGEGYAIAEDGKKDKDKLKMDLMSLARALRTRMRDEAMKGAGAGGLAGPLAEAFGLVVQAKADLEANNSPQLVVESLYFAVADKLEGRL